MPFCSRSSLICPRELGVVLLDRAAVVPCDGFTCVNCFAPIVTRVAFPNPQGQDHIDQLRNLSAEANRLLGGYIDHVAYRKPRLRRDLEDETLIARLAIRTFLGAESARQVEPIN